MHDVDVDVDVHTFCLCLCLSYHVMLCTQRQWSGLWHWEAHVIFSNGQGCGIGKHMLSSAILCIVYIIC